MIESHRSLQDLYEVSCPELDVVVNAASEHESVLRTDVARWGGTRRASRYVACLDGEDGDHAALGKTGPQCDPPLKDDRHRVGRLGLVENPWCRRAPIASTRSMPAGSPPRATDLLRTTMMQGPASDRGTS